MASVLKAFQSSIGTKILMSLTGLAMVGFLLGHLTGNLLIFLGPDAINEYTEKLHSLPAVVWGTRIFMLGCIVVHIFTAKKLTMLNMKASATKYAVQASRKASMASKNMMPTGAIIFIYISYHLAHYTFRATNPEFSKLTEHDTYSMVMLGFQTPWIASFYIFAMVVLGFHLNHGFRSAFQTLGVSHPKNVKTLERSGALLSIVISLGFLSIPLSVMFGLLK
jgi:succinate dehydrogenase / fumarate reductase cytochrome b subunit